MTTIFPLPSESSSGGSLGSPEEVITSTSNASVNIITEVVSAFELKVVGPNPFNPTLSYEFSVSMPSNIKVVIYNLNGREVYSNDMGYTMPGRYNKTWDGSLFPAGIYIISILSDNDIDSRKIVLIK